METEIWFLFANFFKRFSRICLALSWFLYLTSATLMNLSFSNEIYGVVGPRITPSSLNSELSSYTTLKIVSTVSSSFLLEMVTLAKYV